ncbi:beta-eliminating lyase-related protein [Glycomyces sp. NPDC048151]|uniref:beta-eliminating lyase-related protein n=1 Tax=Glycomyces sp. NPDC048151 TaxID=3364002 RepID=UPI00371955E4
MAASSAEHRKLERIFAILDSDKSGVIERRDFELLAATVAESRNQSEGSPEAEALRATLVQRFERMAAQVDADGNGEVTFDEWLAYNESNPSDEELERIIDQTVFGAFASDNNAGVHPDVMAALNRVNVGYAGAYGHDLQTRQAVGAIRDAFGDAAVYFVFNGTAANVLGLKAVTRSWESVLCAASAHIATDEAAAPENYLGCKIIAIPTPDGKLTVPLIERHRVAFDGVDRHNPTRVVSISNPTELGTLYTPEEVRAIADCCHEHGMLLHLDGARIFNAAAALDTDLKALTSGAGVDVFSLGGTKNGMMMGEAVLFFDRSLSEHFMYMQKQAMQTLSKMRFIAAQFQALLERELWLANARQANAMARLLAESVAELPGLTLDQPVYANGVFVKVDPELLPRLQNEAHFYVWDPDRGVVRWMTSYDTNEDDVRNFVRIVRRAIEA